MSLDSLNRIILKLGRACVFWGISCVSVLMVAFMANFVYSIITAQFKSIPEGLGVFFMGLFVYLYQAAIFAMFVGPVNAIMLCLLYLLRVNSTFNSSKAIVIESIVYLIAIISSEPYSKGYFFDSYWPLVFIVPALVISGLIQKTRTMEKRTNRKRHHNTDE